MKIFHFLTLNDDIILLLYNLEGFSPHQKNKSMIQQSLSIHFCFLFNLSNIQNFQLKNLKAEKSILSDCKMFVLGFVNRKIFLSFKKEIIIKGSLKYYFADEQPLIWYSKNQNAPQQINKTFFMRKIFRFLELFLCYYNKLSIVTINLFNKFYIYASMI